MHYDLPSSSKWWNSLWGIWLQWILLAILGRIGGLLIGLPVYFILALTSGGISLPGAPYLVLLVVGLGGAIVSGSLGSAQSWLMERYLRVGDAWMAVSVAGGASAAIIGNIALNAGTLTGYEQGLAIFLVSTTGATAYQSLLLYRYLPAQWRWTWGYIISWMISLPLLWWDQQDYVIYELCSSCFLSGLLVVAIISSYRQLQNTAQP